MHRMKAATLVACWLVAASTAGANELFCATAATTLPAYYCADADTGGTVNVLAPDALDARPVSAAVGGGGGSGLGFFGTASASAGPGALHAYAAAHVTPQPITDVVINADRSIAHARLYDSGIIDAGTSGAAVGTPVALTFTMHIDGLFTGDGEARNELLLFNGIQYVGQRSDLVNGGRPASTFTFTLGGWSIGDSLSFLYQLTARAAANGAVGSFNDSVADASNTALLSFDFLTPGVVFRSASGHDYSTFAIPGDPGGSTISEPVPALLLVAGIAAASFRRRVRSSAA